MFLFNIQNSLAKMLKVNHPKILGRQKTTLQFNQLQILTLKMRAISTLMFRSLIYQ